MHRSLMRFGVAFALFVLPATAAAQPDEQLDEAARLTFESAREAFVAGDYEAALSRFRQAYELSQRPGLLYNIAQTLDRLRRDQETIDALREYLDASPDAPNRAEVEARIRVLERALEERGGPDPDPDPAETGGGQSAQPPPPVEPPEDDDGGLGVLHPAMFIAAGGLALAGGVLTAWSGMGTLDRNEAYTSSTSPGEVQALYDDAQTYQTMTNVFIGVTATFGAAAVALAIFTDWNAFGGGEESATATLRPTVSAGPNGAVVGLGGDF